MTPTEGQTTTEAGEHVDPLSVLERAAGSVENLSRIFRADGHRLTADLYLMEVDEIKQARIAVVGLISERDALLEALVAILHTYDDGGVPLGKAFAMANSAIAKSTGAKTP